MNKLLHGQQRAIPNYNYDHQMPQRQAVMTQELGSRSITEPFIGLKRLGKQVSPIESKNVTLAIQST